MIAIPGQAHHGLVRANHAARLLGNFLHRAFQRLVPGNGLGCICSALQGKQVILHVLFGLVLGGFVQGDNKAGSLAGILNGLGHGLDRKKGSVLATILPQGLFARWIA